LKNGYINRNEGFRTHYLDWQPETENGSLPVIGVHGNLSNARMFRWIGERLSSGAYGSPRRLVAVDIRGCGESGMPEAGFSLRHMASDVEAVMDRLGIRKAHFMAYSRGVGYTLQLALQHPGRIEGLVIGDYGTHYPRLGEAWARRAEEAYDTYASWEQLFDAVSAVEGITRKVFEEMKEDYYLEDNGIVRKRYLKDLPARMRLETEESDLAAALDNVQGPILVLQGTEAGALLSENQLEPYRSRQAAIVRVEGAGHDVYEPREQTTRSLDLFFRGLY
jgi:pimeloyl-ACP methyl ester carboxylesterase